MYCDTGVGQTIDILQANTTGAENTTSAEDDENQVLFRRETDEDYHPPRYVKSQEPKEYTPDSGLAIDQDELSDGDHSALKELRSTHVRDLFLDATEDDEFLPAPGNIDDADDEFTTSVPNGNKRKSVGEPQTKGQRSCKKIQPSPPSNNSTRNTLFPKMILIFALSNKRSLSLFIVYANGRGPTIQSQSDEASPGKKKQDAILQTDTR